MSRSRVKERSWGQLKEGVQVDFNHFLWEDMVLVRFLGRWL
jgi:hypothetical protein